MKEEAFALVIKFTQSNEIKIPVTLVYGNEIWRFRPRVSRSRGRPILRREEVTLEIRGVKTFVWIGWGLRQILCYVCRPHAKVFLVMLWLVATSWEASAPGDFVAPIWSMFAIRKGRPRMMPRAFQRDKEIVCRTILACPCCVPFYAPSSGTRRLQLWNDFEELCHPWGTWCRNAITHKLQCQVFNHNTDLKYVVTCTFWYVYK